MYAAGLPTPEPPPMEAPTVRLTPRGHGEPPRPPERAAVSRKRGPGLGGRCSLVIPLSIDCGETKYTGREEGSN